MNTYNPLLGGVQGWVGKQIIHFFDFHRLYGQTLNRAYFVSFTRRPLLCALLPGHSRQLKLTAVDE